MNDTERYFNQICDELVKQEALTHRERESFQIPVNAGQIIPDLIEKGINPDVLAAVVVGVVAKMPLVTSSELGDDVVQYESGTDTFLLTKGRVCFVNPLKTELVKRVVDMRKSGEISFHQFGVVSYNLAISGHFASAESTEQRGARVSEESEKARAEQIISKCIERAFEQGASDIHISAGHTRGDVRIRLDNRMRPLDTFEMEFYERVSNTLFEMAQMQPNRMSANSGKIKWKTATNKDIELRLESIPTKVNGIRYQKFTLRILSSGKRIIPLDNIGLSKRDRDLIRRCGRKPKGIFLVTGPTGSGKSSSLLSVLQDIRKDNPDRTYYTLENPVETEMEGLYQIEVDDEGGPLSFAIGMRSLMRLDPDVILVGEIRDEESASRALSLALTGHLVFGTLHTNDSQGSISRLQDLGLESSYLSESLIGASAQRLVRKVCPHCATSHTYAELAEEYRRVPWIDETFKFKRAKPGGCDKCGKTGYRGRQVIHELFINDEETREMILRKQNGVAIRRDQTSRGVFFPMWEDAYRLIGQGITTFEEVALCLDVDDLTTAIKHKSGIFSGNSSVNPEKTGTTVRLSNKGADISSFRSVNG